MNDQENCLNKLLNSCKKKAASWPMGAEKVSLDFYRNKNDSVLILIGGLNHEINSKSLNEYEIISKDELFFKTFTGCTGPSSIDQMLMSFDEYHEESISNDISAFLSSLEASKVVICYPLTYGSGSKAALVILYRICQQISIDCIPIIVKPALFNRGRYYQSNFKDLLNYIDTHIYHIYDENLLVYKQTKEITSYDFRDAWESEILELAILIMESPNLWGTSVDKRQPVAPG